MKADVAQVTYLSSRAAATPQRMGGFSLVEAMVGMTAGLILIAGVGQIYLGTRNTYRLQEAQARLQEDGRFVIEYLKRNIRIAGYRSIPWNTAVIAFPARAVAPIFATGQVITGGVGTISVRTQGGGDGNGHPDGRVTDCLGTPLDRCDVVINTFSVDTDAAELECEPIVVTMTQEKDETNPLLNECTVLSGVTTRTTVAKGLQPIVSGFGNFTILYGLDTDSDRAANQYIPGASVPSASWGNVVSARIVFDLRSEDNLTAAAKSYLFNGASVTDRRLRRRFETTIALRNKLP